MSWDDLNQAGPCGHVFASAAYLDLIGRTFRGQIEESVIHDGAELAGGARLLVRRSPLALRAVVPPYTPYSAIQLDRLPSESEIHRRSSNLESLIELLEQRYAAAALHLAPQLSDVRPFSWRKWSVEPLYTYRISLKHDASPASWSESARRIARRESDEFESIEIEPDILGALSAEGYRRSNRKSPLDASSLAAFLVDARSSVGAQLRGVRRKSSGKVEAGVAVLVEGDTAYYWIAGGVPGSAMTVLLSTLFEDLADSGIGSFDFVGANTAAIAEFKRRFGGELTTYYRAVWKRGVTAAVEDAILSRR